MQKSSAISPKLLTTLSNRLHKAVVNSLPVRALSAVVVIASLALMTAISSGLLAWVAESDAKAINTAGSIRMATYRMNYLLASHYQNLDNLDNNFQVNHQKPIATQLAEDMRLRLNNLEIYEQSRGNQDKAINAQIEKIQTIWYSKLEPLLIHNNGQQFFAVSTQYINSVDDLVKQIQVRNEARQSYQQTLQISSLVVTLIIMLIGLYELQQNVLVPVKRLQKATNQFREGGRPQVEIEGYEEFIDLGKSFNDMTRALSSYQDDLEAEVARKTFHLTQSNQALTLLYNFAKELSNQNISFPKLQLLINQFAELMPHLHLTLCLNNEQYKTKDVIALKSTTLDGSLGSFCQQQHCDECHLKQQSKSWIFPIHHQQTELGELIVTPKNTAVSSPTKAHVALHTQKNKIELVETDPNWVDNKPSFDETELLNTLANLIAMVFSSQKQREQEHQLILFEERNTIARELHDSLAQSLSYLKIQIALLSTLLKQSDDNSHERIEQIMDQTKEGLNSAYSQLRELLVTFRLKIEEGDFDQALQQACDEFSQKGGFIIHLDNRLTSSNLTANEQVDLLQITREALSNINRHANAKNAHVSLSQSQIGAVTLRVQDDGQGLVQGFDQCQHHGLKIMQERSHNLDGEFAINNVLPHGTAILVKFMPKLFVLT
nr:histidine kinase [uncultured Moraxella sp.]